MPTKKLAKLTAEEDKEWVFTFHFHKNRGLSDAAADKQTWKEMQQLSPRLKKFDGCKP